MVDHVLLDTEEHVCVIKLMLLHCGLAIKPNTSLPSGTHLVHSIFAFGTHFGT